MNTRLFKKVEQVDLSKVLKRKGYAWFEKGFYNVNIIGVRSNDNNRVTNKFDDVLVLIYRTQNGWDEKYYIITTKPGAYYMNKKLLNPKGTAILVPGQYRGCWSIGKHNGKYNALVQTKPVKVYRDNNMDLVYDMKPETIDNGIFGINIHRSNEFVESKLVNTWSAGCQVFGNPNEFRTFMYYMNKAADNFGNHFTYTLLEEKDLI